jgi:2-keto-4-pentenoate hydratase/2-oxohepta-3-ene-1,7-dioic acid hydratase in catechol pathway
MTRWARYAREGAIRFGTLEGETLTEHSGDLFGEHAPTGETHALWDVELLAPVAPGKIVALANNFRALIEKLGLEVPPEPLYFIKANGSLHATGKPIVRPAGYDGKIIYEGELGLVIGTEARDVSVDEAMGHLFGCTCVNDVTAIEILNRNPGFQQWTRSKAADTFGVLGPVVATGLDPAALTVRTVLNGQERQNYPVSDMAFSAAELISRISHDMTLHPGDVIACGTSVGVGSMKPDSVVEVSIEGIGALVNTFAG